MKVTKHGGSSEKGLVLLYSVGLVVLFGLGLWLALFGEIAEVKYSDTEAEKSREVCALSEVSNNIFVDKVTINGTTFTCGEGFRSGN